MSNATDNATGGLYASNGCFYGEDGVGIAGTNLAVLIIASIGIFAFIWLEVPFFRLKSKRAFPNNVLPHAYVCSPTRSAFSFSPPTPAKHKPNHNQSGRFRQQSGLPYRGPYYASQ